MAYRGKLGIVLFALLLLLGCGRQKEKELVIIFENPAPYNAKDEKFLMSSTMVYQPIKNQSVKFVDESGVAYMFVATKPYDTLVITSVNRNTVELSHNYHHYIYTEHVLLQADDTVRIRYNGKEKPTYTSLNSEENNRLYLLRDVLMKDWLCNDPEFINELGRGYFSRYMQQKLQGSDLFNDYTPPEELEAVYYASLPKAKHALDSLVALGQLPREYEEYYRYYLRRAEVVPPYERQLGETEFALTPQQYAFFNDSLINLISYRQYLARCGNVFAQNGTEWITPTFETKNLYDGATINPKDGRAVFNRLVEMKQSGDNRISDMSYDLMLYFCVDEITNFGLYPKEDAAVYLAKYEELSTRFLVQKIESAGSFWGFPFKLLIFILQVNICIAIFYSIYRLLLYSSVAFVTRRIFLLSGIVFSLIAATGWISVEIFIPDRLLEISSGTKLVGWIMLGLYGLCALFFLYKIGKRLVYIWTLRRDSWRVKDGSYILYILKDIVTSPSTFFRMVFMSWGDFFNTSQREERDLLLAHEEYHVKHLHSIDTVVMMLMRILCWFNPFFNKYSRELKLVNEYAADRAVVKEAGIRVYMRTIVDNTEQQEAYGLLSHSFDGQKDMDKRIKMMRRYGDKSYGSVLRLICIIPVFVLLVYFSPEFVVKHCSLPEVLTTLL